MGAEGSQVRVLPKDVEGDAPFALWLINLTQLSSSPSGPLMLSEEGERLGLAASSSCLCSLASMVFFFVCDSACL